MISAIFWDVDGVLLDSEEIHAKTESETAKAFGINISPKKVIELYSGIQIEKEFRDMAKRFKKDFPLGKILSLYRRNIQQRLHKGIPVVSGVTKVLSLLSAHYKLGFVTSSEKFFIESALNKVGLLDFFQARVYGEDVKHHKPDPEPFLKAARILKIKPDQAVVIEDSISGFKAAKAAGMLLIARKAVHNKNKDFSLADYIVEDLKEIPKIMSELKQMSSGRGTFVASVDGI